MYGYRVWFKINQDQPFFSCEISHYSKKFKKLQNSLFFEKNVKKLVILGQCN
jgi:hypothetical protein